MHSDRASRWWLAIAGLCLIGYAGGFLNGRLTTGSWPFAGLASSTEERHSEGLAGDDHAGHDHSDLSKSPFARANAQPAEDRESEHDHAHSDAASLLVSEAAKKNLGLTEKFLQPIELRSFTRTLSVPSIIVDNPGRTRLPVSAPMTGIVTHVHAVTGEAIKPGDLILEMRLTHEDLVTAQKEYLQTLGDRDIELKQIARIEGLATAGAVSNKTLIDRQFSRDKLESQLRSQREALRLHGLSDQQISHIDEQRRLLTEIRIVAPHPDDHSDEELHLSLQKGQKLSAQSASANPFRVASVAEHDGSHPATQPKNIQPKNIQPKKIQPRSTQLEATLSAASLPAAMQHSADDSHLLVLQDLHVQKGHVVNAGDALCVLADYKELLIEGQAFETEANVIAKAKLANWSIEAVVGDNSDASRIKNLQLSRVDNEIDPATRTLKFYVALSNELVDESVTPEGQRHVTWKYRAGQRLQILLPVEQWTEQIVLPIDAVVREGLDSYVFQQNGDHFERVAVHEVYRDQTQVVIGNDGALYPGDVVAMRGAYLMQLALKNQAGGAVDPHAGHNH